MSSRQPNAIEFVNFVAELLRRRGKIVETHKVVGNRTIDIVAAHDYHPHVALVEVKLNTPQTRVRVDHTVTQVRENERVFSGLHSVDVSSAVAIPGVLTESYSKSFQDEDIAVWDGRVLLEWSSEVGMEREAVGVLSAQDGESITQIRRRFNRQLRSLPSLSDTLPGKGEWSKYQRNCEATLTHLFVPPLELPRYEESNESRVNRRDIIMANYATEGFWSFMRMQYKADFVVVDAKNLSGDVDKNDVLQLANYLSEGGLGLFGMIITPNGASLPARITQREQWLLYRKMIIVLNHTDVDQMLDNDFATGNGENVIRQRIEDFRISL